MMIITRAEWGAAPGRATPQPAASRLYLHHTAGAAPPDADHDGDRGDDYMRAMQRFHQAKGWGDIAYNFAIDPDGLEVYEGRGPFRRPAAQRSFNRDTNAIAVMGDWSTRTPPDALLRRIAELVAYGHDQGWWTTPTLTGGHRDAPGQSTTCPGDALWSRIPIINRYATDGEDEPMLKQGDKGRPVADLQRGLIELGHDLGSFPPFGPGYPDGADGSFGRATTTAVKAWQAAAKVPETGSVSGVVLAAILDEASRLRDTEHDHPHVHAVRLTGKTGPAS